MPEEANGELECFREKVVQDVVDNPQDDGHDDGSYAEFQAFQHRSE